MKTTPLFLGLILVFLFIGSVSGYSQIIAIDNQNFDNAVWLTPWEVYTGSGSKYTADYTSSPNAVKVTYACASTNPCANGIGTASQYAANGGAYYVGFNYQFIDLTGFNPASGDTIDIRIFQTTTSNIYCTPVLWDTMPEIGKWYQTTCQESRGDTAGYFRLKVSLTKGYSHTVTLTTIFDDFTASTSPKAPLGSPPVANFIANDTTVFVNDYVQFNDTSSYTPDNWTWYDNGEYFSGEQNPIRQMTFGWHNISLYAENDLGADWENKTNYIYAASDTCKYYPSAIINGEDTVYTNTDVHYSLSTNINASSIVWGFTDGGLVQNPKNLRLYRKTGSQWYAMNTATGQYDVPVSETTVYYPLVNFVLTSEQYDEHMAYVQVQDANCAYSKVTTKSLTVLGDEYTHTIPIFVYDTSNSNQVLNNFNLTLYDYTDNTSKTYTNINSGVSIPAPVYHLIALAVTKNGYMLCDRGWPNNECMRYMIYPDNPSNYQVWLTPTCGAPAGKMCEHISVQWGIGATEGTGNTITNMKVIIDNQVLYTNAGGVINIHLNTNSTYYVQIVENSVYTGTTGYITTGADGINQWDYFEVKVKAQQPTTTPVPTTIKPTVTIPSDATPDEKIVFHWKLLFGEDNFNLLVTAICIVSMFCIGGYIGSKGDSGFLTAIAGGELGLIIATIGGFAPFMYVVIVGVLSVALVAAKMTLGD